MPKKNLVFAIALTVAILLVVSLAFSFVKKQVPSELVMSGHPRWAPIMYQQNDQIVGAGPEIAAAILSDLGVKSVSPHAGTWDVVQEKAKSGEVDMLVAAYRTDEREAYMEYSIPYTVDPVVLVVKKDKTFHSGKKETLLDRKGVVTAGDSYGEEFDAFIKESLEVQSVKTPEEAFALLESEEVDYFVYALYSAEGYIFENDLADQFEILPDYVSAEEFYFTISKNSPYIKLLPKFNALLAQYKKEGKIEQIIEKHKKSLWNKSE